MTETITCPFCPTSSSDPVIHENGFIGQQCPSCGLIFISPRPSLEETAQLYAAGEAHLSPDLFMSNSRLLNERLKARDTIRRLRNHVASGSLLEIGPGNGNFLSHARRAGFDVYGVELNPRQAEFIRHELGIPCATSLAAVSTIGHEPFDVVYHCDVLSHFHDPIAEFKQINALLKLGAYHVFQTGNWGDIDHSYFPHVGSFQYPDHLFFYSQRSLLELLNLTGFDHVCTYRYSVRPEQLLAEQLERILGRRTSRSSANRTTVHTPPPVRTTRAGKAAHDALNLTYYALRSTLGRLGARHDVPQTLIVVARKVA